MTPIMITPYTSDLINMLQQAVHDYGDMPVVAVLRHGDNQRIIAVPINAVMVSSEFIVFSLDPTITQKELQHGEQGGTTPSSSESGEVKT